MTEGFSQPNIRKFSIAPMLDCTDRHARYFLRLFSPNILLYTEMVTTGAILHGDRERLLGFNEAEHPVAVQLGGSNPADLAECAKICTDYGYDEINLNVGCPSDRVQSGSFGACLMAEPALVGECVTAMKAVTDVPVTVKHRIGIDDMESFDLLHQFAQKQVEAGVDALIVHARKAWLKGLSPKQNREIPELKYDWVYRLKALLPETPIVINGGIKTLDECEQHLKKVDGVMLGREPYHNPYLLADVDARLFGDDNPPPDRFDILHAYYEYIERQLSQGIPPSRITRHIMGLFLGQPNAKNWRRYLSETIDRKTGSIDDFLKAENLLTRNEQRHPSARLSA